MKLWLSIVFKVVLLLVFTTTLMTRATACDGAKSAHESVKTVKKEGQNITLNPFQKEVKNAIGCSKDCQKPCCQKVKTHKKRCCNDPNCNGCCGENGCNCSAPSGFAAVLTPTLSLSLSGETLGFKTPIIPFIETVPKSVFIEFWQPPKL